MAAIREELILVDRFSQVFSQYLRMGQQAASAASTAGAEQSVYNTKLAELGTAASRAGSALTELGEKFQAAADSTGQAADEQEKVNQKFQEGAKSTDSLVGKLKGLITTYLSFQGVKRALDWVGENLKLADTQRNAENQLRAVLNNMGVQEVTVPVTADTTQVMSAFDAITAKASEIQGRGIYGDEAMIAGAAELSTYFKDANAITSMMDTLADYTMGMTGGGAVDKDAMVEYATGLGKIMSGSYDAMTKKGFEFSEAQKAIIEGTATEAQIVEALGREYLDCSSDMQAAAAINSVIAESWGGLYEAMSDTPEGKIIQLQNRLGDLREELGNRIYPAVLQLVDVFNNGFDEIEEVLTDFSDICSGVVLAISWIADAAMNIASIITENSDLMALAMSVLIGMATAVGGAMVASALASAAAWAMANWPLILIAAAVTGIIQRTLQMGGTWEDVCGVMGSILYELYAVIYNVVADAWNLFAIFAEFFANFMNDPVGAVVRLVFDAFDWILGIVETVASAIDAVFGSSFAEKVNGFRSTISQFASDTFGENEIQIERMDKKDYGEAWNRGDELGREFYGALSEMKDMSLDDMFGFSDLLDNSGIPDTLGDISADTSAIKRSVALSEEDMKLLVDMAERQYVNNINLTAQTPVITINGQNTGDAAEDLERLASALQKILLEQAASHTDLSYV